MIAYLKQFPVYSGNIGPTVDAVVEPSTTAATELTNEIIWILQASGY